MLAKSAHQGLTGAAVRELAAGARSRMRLGTGGYRREYVHTFAQRVEVGDDVIRTTGSKSNLLRRLVAAKGGKPAGINVLQPRTEVAERERASSGICPI